MRVLYEFLSSNRGELIARCREKVAQRLSPEATTLDLEHGVPIFLDQLIKTLCFEQSQDPAQSLNVSGPSGGGKPALSEMGETAALHGRELLQLGFTLEQVVHDYGDVCQAITDLAFESGAEIQVDEFRTLNRCLDNAIALAVTEFNYQRDSVVADRTSDELNVRLGSFAHELRNLLNTAQLALTAMREGDLGLTGATGAVLDRSLIGLNNLIDRSLAEVRIKAGLPVRHNLFSLADFIAETRLSASLDAQMRGCIFTVSTVDPELAIDADRDLLCSALGNLLQNAFKFSRHHKEVTLNAYAAADRVLIDVKDTCGGLAEDAAEKMFLPFTQHSPDRTGLGLGLSISRQGVEANGGTLSVRNIAGLGCIFTINLPRHILPPGGTETPLPAAA